MNVVLYPDQLQWIYQLLSIMNYIKYQLYLQRNSVHLLNQKVICL
ncbi:unnamed protein product [Trichobilharzia regenti]|nr:unnamed protein product [Trichobilharzia regenti]